MKLTVNRRVTLGLLASVGGCASTAQQGEAREDGVFRHGVASGDPQSDSVVLWTRIESDAAEEPVAWEIAEDGAFSRVAAQGRGVARAGADHTFKIVAGGLSPGGVYFYRFRAKGSVSPVGRTRTLPVGPVQRLGVALVSCSNYAFGHFNAYDAIAKDERVDIVLHTGDYLYEYGGPGSWGDDVARVLGRAHAPAHEIVTLADYRTRHAQYKSDPGAQAMHAAHPFIACWDDHEVTNNPWIGGAQNHQPETEGDWPARRAAALQAYYEWMPIRDPAEGRRREDFWRTYKFGDLATLITLETRHTARGEQVDYHRHFERIRTRADRDAFMRDVIGDPSRRMISGGMEQALREGLSASVADGQPWRLIGNASPIARMLVPDAAALGFDPRARRGFDPAAPAGPDLFWTGRWNLPFYTDTWDGYPAAREAFYDLCREAGAQDLLVLTGDSHSFWMNELRDGAGRAMGLELGTAGVTSPGDFVESGWPRELAERLDRMFEQLDEVVWTDNLHQGYVRVVMDRQSAIASFVAVDTVLSTDYRPEVLRETRIVRRDGALAYAG
jgi:alkaline phosphatase D